MDTTLITALAGIVGTLCGGSASVATAWVTHKARVKRELLRADRNRRETLYGEFIDECSKRVMDSLETTLDKPDRLLTIYALLNRIRLCASESVLREALALAKFITEQYFSPNLSPREFRERVREGSIDPLKAFSDACRGELLSIKGLV
jgi:hypothetical protein